MPLATDRMGYLGGSDMAVVLGVSKWKSRRKLWLQKTGRALDTASGPDIDRGNELEEKAAEKFLQADPRFHLGELAQLPEEGIHHPDHLWAVAHPDRLLHRQGTYYSEPEVVELKCPRITTYRKIKLHGPPWEHVCQVHFYLGMTNNEVGWLFYWCADAWEGHLVRIDFDPQLYEQMLEEGERFWHLVVNDEEPEDEAPGELPELPEMEGTLTRVEGDPWETLLKETAEARRDAKLANEIKVDAEEAVKALMLEKGLELIELEDRYRARFGKVAGRVAYKQAIAEIEDKQPVDGLVFLKALEEHREELGGALLWIPDLLAEARIDTSEIVEWTRGEETMRFSFHDLQDYKREE